MKISLIVAMGANHEIGKNNDLIWHLPKDMNFFKDTTKSHIVLMGRKNWDSIPEKYRPLPGRENVVLTRTNGYSSDGATVFNDITTAIRAYNKPGEDRTFFIIGGGEIYKLALEMDLVEEMFITHIQASFDADAFFPEIDYSNWKNEIVMKHQKDEKNKYDFVVKRYFK